MSLAMALPDGQAVIVESLAPPKPNRRQRTALKP